MTKVFLIRDLLLKFLSYFLFCFYLATVSDSFLLTDDYETYWLPALRWFGTSLSDGIFPTNMGPGGMGSNFISEAQFGFFNPVIFVTSIFTTHFDNLLLFSIIFKAIILAMLQISSARVFSASGIRRFESELFGVGVTTSGFLMYMEVSSWTQSLISMCFSIFALSYLLQKSLARREFILFLFLLYLSFSVGYVYTVLPNLILLSFAAVKYFELAFFKDRLVTFAVFIFALATLIIFLPGLQTRNHTWRSSIWPSNSGFFTPNLGDLLGSPMLSMPQDLTTWTGVVTKNPTGYVFIGLACLISLVSINNISISHYPRKVSYLFLGAFLLVSLGPSDMGPFHWPGRYMPWLAFSIIWVAANLSVGTSKIPRSRQLFGYFLLFIGFLRALALDPSNYLGSFFSFGLGLIFTFFLLKSRRGVKEYRVILFSILIFGILLQHTFMNFSSVKGFAKYASPNIVSKFDTSGLRKDLITFQLANSDRITAKGEDFGARFFFGHQADMLGIKMINTGTAIGHNSLGKYICPSFNGSTCPEAVTQLVSLDAHTSVRLIDVFEINQIIAEHEYHSDLNKLLEPLGWTQTFTNYWREIWVRDTLEPQDMVVNTGEHDFKVIKGDNFEAGNKKILILTNSNYKGGNVQLSQINYPGLKISSSNNVPIKLNSFGAFDSFYQIKIPPGEQSILITWDPPLWQVLKILHVFIIFSWIAIWSVLFLKRSRKSKI